MILNNVRNSAYYSLFYFPFKLILLLVNKGTKRSVKKGQNIEKYTCRLGPFIANP